MSKMIGNIVMVAGAVITMVGLYFAWEFWYELAFPTVIGGLIIMGIAMAKW